MKSLRPYLNVYFAYLLIEWNVVHVSTIGCIYILCVVDNMEGKTLGIRSAHKKHRIIISARSVGLVNL